MVEQRRVATKQFLNYAVQHLYLRTHDAYINFFQVHLLAFFALAVPTVTNDLV